VRPGQPEGRRVGGKKGTEAQLGGGAGGGTAEQRLVFAVSGIITRTHALDVKALCVWEPSGEP